MFVVASYLLPWIILVVVNLTKFQVFFINDMSGDLLDISRLSVHILAINAMMGSL